jgi:3-oxoacyl-[acyl-carrier-protein] synthase-1
MPDERVALVGVGMITAVGLTTAETAASARAGTMRFAASQFHDKEFDRFVLAEVPDDGLPVLPDGAGVGRTTARERRMIRLALPALAECIAPLRSRGVAGPLPLCLALPELETTLPVDRPVFLSRLAAHARGVVEPQLSDASHTGRAGGLVAVGQAVAAIRAGQAEFVLAGGIDTYCDAYVLSTLDLEQRVKSAANVDGFIPGEGAAFLLFARPTAAAAAGVAPLAYVSPVVTGFEAGHLYSDEPYRGDGLASTLARLVAVSVLEAPVAEVFSSMNGESYWGKEWGVAFIRNRAAFHPGHGMHHPAEYFGDTGAACGPIMVGLAAVGMRASYRRSPALVYGSSDRGPRAVVVVSAASH